MRLNSIRKLFKQPCIIESIKEHYKEHLGYTPERDELDVLVRDEFYYYCTYDEELERLKRT